MALVLKDRVKETTTTTGTGSFALAGAVTGYDSFGQIGNGNTTYYAVYLDGGSEWEVGIGTYTAPSTLSRDTILASSNSGSVVTFSAGQKTIWCDYPAGKAVYTDATGSISQSIVNVSSITGYISSPDYVQFDTNYATALGVGQLGWDGNNTLAVGMAGGNVVQHIGEDQYFYIKASSAITKGQLIMFTGAVGASGVLTGAPSTGVTVPEYIMGVAAESIANNGFGLVQCFGELTNVNTNGFNEGDVLYYDSAVTGGLTNVYPSSGIIVTVAAVAKKSAGGGVLSIRLTETPRITASTGISVSQTNAGATITNTAPDQTVAIASGTGISVTGTYPNFTVSNTGVTSVTGTSPVVSSGGTTPAISIPAANGSTNGYLTSTDWTTFNNKAASFTYTTNYIPYGQGTTTPNQSANLTFNGTTLTATGLSGPLNGTVGATTPNTGAFTTLTSNGATTFTANTASTSTTTGTAVITGGLGVSGRINAANFDGIVGANTAAAGSFTTVTATSVNTQNTFGFKNRIINGAMVIDQRNAGASVSATTSFPYTLDRWQAIASQNSKYTVQQNAGSVTPPIGFTNYLGVTSSSAYTVGSSEQFRIIQSIEGLNITDLGWGTANAKTVTLSFWVRSSLTGTFGGSLGNNGYARTYPFSYTISSANTWEQKSVTIAGDTSGTWLTTNGAGIILSFGIGVGSTLSGTAGAWAGATYVSATGATSVVGTNGATFYITGVQLEVGSTATSFDTRSYGDELILCQRYYQGNLVNGNSGTSGNFIMRGQSTTTGAYYYWLQFPVLMRAAPTMNVGTVTYSNANSALFFNAASGGAEMTFTVTASGGYVFVPWRADIEL